MNLTDIFQYYLIVLAVQRYRVYNLPLVANPEIRIFTTVKNLQLQTRSNYFLIYIYINDIYWCGEWGGSVLFKS